MKTESKQVIKKADPELSTEEKLAKIKSGGKTVRTTGGEKKNIVIMGKDGSKVIQQQKEEKFEEAGVTKKKRNYVMYEAKLGTETTTETTKIDAPRKKEKPVLRAPEPRIEEKIIQTKKRKEYLDNYQYHETKEIKNPNPRFQVIVEHQRLGDIIGGTFEETSYQRQVFSQGSSRPMLTEKTTKTTKTGSAIGGPTLRGTKSQVTTIKKSTVTSGEAAKDSRKPGSRGNQRNPGSSTGGKEKISETSVKNRREGTGSRTETRTEQKTTTSGRGGQSESKTTTKTTTTRTTGDKNADSKTTQSSTTTKTTTRTTKTTEGDGGSKSETTVTKTESKSTSGGEPAAAEGSSIRKKYAKGRFGKQ